jgi:hypothetical protein
MKTKVNQRYLAKSLVLALPPLLAAAVYEADWGCYSFCRKQ